jgi:pimeloyl-ACP methyl ester carboxylesterase
VAVTDPGPDRIEVAGRTVAFRRAGTGPPVMLLHGGWSDGRQWLGQLHRLADGFDLVAWDAPGCGGSDDPPPDAGLGAYADALAGLAAALGLERTHLCGLSWGGGLALEVCRRHPGLTRSAVLIGAYAGWAGSLPPEEVRARLDRVVREARRPPEEWAAGYLDGFFAGPVPEDVRAAQLRMMMDVRPAGLVAMIRAFAAADLRPALPRIDVPVLVLHGERDARSPVRVARRLHAAIPGSRLVLLPGVGHAVPLEAPEAFACEVRAFLRSIPG